MNKKVYISIPISGKDINQVKLYLDLVKNGIKSSGSDSITPFDVSPDSNASYAEHMGKDIQDLLECDAVFFCRGWQNSKGCQAEFEVAKIYGKQMIFE